MAKTREQKKQIIEELEQELKKASSVMFVDYYGLDVGSIEDFRKMAKDRDCRYLVAKKTLLEIALEDTQLEKEWVDKIKGGAGLVFGYESPLEPARIIEEFREEHEEMNPQGGIFEKEYIEASKIKELAEIPTYDQLLSKFVLTIKAPVNNFVHALNGNLNNLVCALSNIKDKKS